jgi:hypothetical protein
MREIAPDSVSTVAKSRSIESFGADDQFRCKDIRPVDSPSKGPDTVSPFDIVE